MTRLGFITALGIGQICSWGSLYYSYPLVAEAMHRDLGWDKPHLYGAATVGLLLAGLLSYPVGRAIDRGNGRLVMAGASVVAGLLFLAWSQVQTLPTFYVLAAGLGALQAAVLYEPAFALIAWRLGPVNARRDITTLTLWGGFASTVFIPLTQWQIDAMGWRGALVGLGLVNLLVCTALYAMATRQYSASVSAGHQPSRHIRAGAVRAALVTPVFWAFAVALVAYSAVFTAFTFHLYPLLVARGFSSSDVVLAMAVIGPAQVAGRVVVSVFASGRSVRALGSIVVAFFPASLLLLAIAPSSLAIAILVAAVYGAANGIFTIVRGLAVPEMVSKTDYGSINGVLAAPATFARAVAPMGAALLWAAYDSDYGAVLTATILGAIVFAIAFWVAALAPRPVSLNDGRVQT